MKTNARYDFDKETDKEFLREAGKVLQEEVITLRIENIQLRPQKAKDEEIKSQLTSKLLILRKRIFDSRQEKKEKLKKFKNKKRKKGLNLVHNINNNKSIIEQYENKELTLETKDIEYTIDKKDQKCQKCGGDQFTEMNNLFEESSEFDVDCTYYILKRHKRKKYKCSCCKNIITAPGGIKLTPGGQFSIQLATQVACDKYEYHIPLERQRIKMKKYGLNVSVNTLFNIKEHLYNLIIEMNELNRLEIIMGESVHLDDSPVTFYNPNKSKGYVWSISNSRGAYYQFEVTKSGKVAKEMIKGFSGVLITDAYLGKNYFSDFTEITHCYCWSHMRRYFFDAMVENKKAGVVVDLIDNLYEVEHQAQNLDELEVLRKNRSSKIFNDIKMWIDQNEENYLSSTSTGKAINYFYAQEEGLTHFLTNKFVPLDNNRAERTQRSPVMGRKNYLYFRSINGADVGMFFYSIVESCKINGLNSSLYITDIALRKLRGEKLETPYQYAAKLKNKILNDLNSKFLSLEKQ